MTTKAHDKYVFYTCYYLAKAGCKISLFTPNIRANLKELYNYYMLPMCANLEIQFIYSHAYLWNRRISAKFLYRPLAVIKAILMSKKIDLIYVSELKIAKTLLSCKKYHQKPIVYDVHDLLCLKEQEETVNLREAFVITNCDGITTTTFALKQIVQRRYNPKVPIEVFPLASLPIVPSHFKPFDPFKISDWNIFYVGQLQYSQGIDVLIEAIYYIKDVISIKIHIIGEGELSNSLKKLTQKLKLEDRVKFYGYLPPAKLQQLLPLADILIAPTRGGPREYTASMKIYEYLGLGRPIIATNRSSVREVLRDRFNALLVEPDNPMAIANAIRTIVKNHQLAQSLARNAQLTYNEYSYIKRAEKLKTFLQSIIVKKLHNNP